MDNYSIVQHPTKPDRVLVLDATGVAVGDTARRGRDDTAILNAFSGGGDLPKQLADAKNKTFESQKQRLSEMDPIIDNVRNALLNTTDKKTSDLLKTKLDMMMDERKRLSTVEIDPIKRGVIDAIKPQLARLKDIETTSPLASHANWAIQNIGSFLNLNPELKAYEESQEGLKIPVTRKLMGEGGSTTATEQESSKKMAFPTGTGLYSKNVRPQLLNNVFDTVKGIAGVDLREELGPDFLKEIGADVGGEVAGPQVGVFEGLKKAGGAVADAFRGLSGGAIKKKKPAGLTAEELEELKQLEQSGY